MKNYDGNKESLYLKYQGKNNFYGWAMPQKLAVNGFKCLSELKIFLTLMRVS